MIACVTHHQKGCYSDVSKSSDDACDASKIVMPSMLSKAAIMPRVVSERDLQRTPRSKSDFAPRLVILGAVMMLKSAPCPCLVLVSRLLQKICICTFFKDGCEKNFTIKTAFVDKIFLALIPTTRILPSGTT